MKADIRVRSVPRAEWPASYRTALERALTQDDDGSGEFGAAMHLRAETLTAYTQTYGQWLDFLQRSSMQGLVDCGFEAITPERVAPWRRENKARGLAPTARRQMLRNLAALLRLLAPSRDWGFITRPGNLPLKRAIPGGPKVAVIHDVSEVMAHVGRLHRVGLAGPEGAERWQALRDAALLGVLATRAPRVGSLVPMTMVRHLEHRPDGTWYLHFPTEHTKGGKSLGYPLDARVSALLTDYLDHARARFPHAGACDKLWMGMKGPLGREGIQRICQRRTMAWFGQKFGPHIFRKWLRASAARRAPELAMDTEFIMGHSAAVSVQSYAEASGLHAALRHGDRIATRRDRCADRAERALAEQLERWQERRR